MATTISKDMTFDQVLRMYPGAAKVLRNFNLGCVGCMGASTETLEQGARAHGVDINQLLTALNELV